MRSIFGCVHLKRLLIVLGISLLPSTLLAENKKQAPNIVLIVADYMGYSDIEPYGSTDIKTPSLNTLASRGLQFSNHYSTAPSCIPSRASLMSGKYPSKVLEKFDLGRGRGLHSKNNTLVKRLNKNGYKTGLIGKWHLGAKKIFSPNDHGFDYFLGFDA
jgi:arylsulfatase A